MKNYHPLFLLILFLSACGQPKKLAFNEFEFQSDYIGNRQITVLLPPSYNEKDVSFPVLYMHDGQMLFDSTTTWNGKEWGIDETLNRLWSEDQLQEIIVVGIDNGGTSLRHPEYFPQKPFEQLNSEIQDSLYQLNRVSGNGLFAEKIKSDDYLRFLVSELKPHIDSTFLTKTDQKNTFIAGSSMGGLISMYAICEYPNVFGGAACLSTHWPGVFSTEDNPVPNEFFKYLASNLPNPENHKLYFDLGTETLDAMYQTLQPVADSIIRNGGYDENNFLSLLFEGDAHDEVAWNNRFNIPLTFLIEK
ncbi:MAG: alpha/beta hydrolase [Ekhidna sp.]|nr:alpha/beta hydrolase [Ekhidna sp.]